LRFQPPCLTRKHEGVDAAVAESGAAASATAAEQGGMNNSSAPIMTPGGGADAPPRREPSTTQPGVPAPRMGVGREIFSRGERIATILPRALFRPRPSACLTHPARQQQQPRGESPHGGQPERKWHEWESKPEARGLSCPRAYIPLLQPRRRPPAAGTRPPRGQPPKRKLPARLIHRISSCSRPCALP